LRFRQNGAVDAQHGRAEEAGELMDSELDAIQERLRALKRELDARESLLPGEDEDAPAGVASTPPGHLGA
jgi:hypothetical protein